MDTLFQIYDCRCGNILLEDEVVLGKVDDELLAVCDCGKAGACDKRTDNGRDCKMQVSQSRADRWREKETDQAEEIELDELPI